MNEADHHKLVQALQTVIGVAMAERLDSMRQATKDTESKLAEQIESNKKGAADSIDSLLRMVQELESKLSSRIEALQKETVEQLESKISSLDSKHCELETKMTESISAANKETMESMDKMQHSVLTRSAELIGRLSRVEENQERILSDLEGRTPEEIDKQLQVRVLAVKTEMEESFTSLRQEVSTLRDEMKRQVQATERVSAFLNSMASVFSVSPPKGPLPTRVQDSVLGSQRDESETPGSDASQEPHADAQTVVLPRIQQMIPQGPDPVPFEETPKLTRQEVDSAVERALGEDWSPGKTVEMRNPMFRDKDE